LYEFLFCYPAKSEKTYQIVNLKTPTRSEKDLAGGKIPKKPSISSLAPIGVKILCGQVQIAIGKHTKITSLKSYF
jgi:hypothetical protein